MRVKSIIIAFIACLCIIAEVSAQTSDSLIVNQLEEEGVKFSHNNSVTLLMSGQEKFDDMFQAIRQARSSVHLEYFNFRNDSIASLLFDILAEKAKEGVEVRALVDGFGTTPTTNRCSNVTSRAYARAVSRYSNSTQYASRGSTTCYTATTARLWSSTDR